MLEWLQWQLGLRAWSVVGSYCCPESFRIHRVHPRWWWWQVSFFGHGLMVWFSSLAFVMVGGWLDADSILGCLYVCMEDE